MTPRASSSRHALESCILQLQALKPFRLSLDLRAAKKPCRSDRSTAPDPLDTPTPPPPRRREALIWLARRRRRRHHVSRSASGRSSDCSGTHLPLGTDSSATNEGSWGSDASEAWLPRDFTGSGVRGFERENSGLGSYHGGAGAMVFELQGNESGYSSEPGYRGDAEFGCDDELDEDDDDGRAMFWGDRSGEGADHMEIVQGGENKFSEQKKNTHHRCRRNKKHFDWRMFAPLR